MLASEGHQFCFVFHWKRKHSSLPFRGGVWGSVKGDSGLPRRGSVTCHHRILSPSVLCAPDSARLIVGVQWIFDKWVDGWKIFRWTIIISLIGIAGKCQPLDIAQNSVEYFIFYLFDVGLEVTEAACLWRLIESFNINNNNSHRNNSDNCCHFLECSPSVTYVLYEVLRTSHSPHYSPRMEA